MNCWKNCEDSCPIIISSCLVSRLPQKLINGSSEVLNIHVIPTQTEHFQTSYSKKVSLLFIHLLTWIESISALLLYYHYYYEDLLRRPVCFPWSVDSSQASPTRWRLHSAPTSGVTSTTAFGFTTRWGLSTLCTGGWPYLFHGRTNALAI